MLHVLVLIIILIIIQNQIKMLKIVKKIKKPLIIKIIKILVNKCKTNIIDSNNNNIIQEHLRIPFSNYIQILINNNNSKINEPIMDLLFELLLNETKQQLIDENIRKNNSSSNNNNNDN